MSNAAAIAFKGRQPTMASLDGGAGLPAYTEFDNDSAPRGRELPGYNEEDIPRSRSTSRSTAGSPMSIRDEKKAAIAAATSNATTVSVSSISGVSAGTASAFVPTVQLQIQHQGKRWLSFPGPPRPDPIPVFQVTANGSLDPHPVYVSVRPARGSGSCFLINGADFEAYCEDQASNPQQLTSTLYRFGPGRAPTVTLADPNVDPKAEIAGEEFEVSNKGVTTRAIEFECSLGKFCWRYAGSKERAATYNASSLLVLEKILDGDEGVGAEKKAGSSSKSKPKVQRIAQFVRNDDFRSPGSKASTAGNGGRLMLDLREVNEKQRESIQRMAVTTVIMMLKKEVDRRRVYQMAMIAGAASGGP